MKSQPDIALVVPCYNEERRLDADVFINELTKNSNLTILFVNDGSEDNTLEVIQKICMANPERALSLSLDRNKGKGEAVRTGLCYLLEKGLYDILGFWDADLAVPLSELNDFMQIFRKNSNVRVVIGSRVHLAGRVIERINMRHYLGRIFATVMCLTFGFNIYDTQCGAKLFDSKVLMPVVEEQLYSNWIFDVELIVRFSRHPLLKGKDNWLYEYPVIEWRDVYGTKRTITSYSDAFIDYIRLIRKYLL